MNYSPLAASLLALALFTTPVLAQETAAEAQPAAEAMTQQIPDEVLVLLNDKRPAAEMSVEELAARAKLAREFTKMETLSENVRKQLQDIVKSARAEIALREEQAAQPAVPLLEAPAPQSEAPVAEQPAIQQPPAVAEQQPPAVADPAPAIEAQTAPAVAPSPTDVEQTQKLDGNAANPEAETQAKVYLEDARAADTLSDDDLRQRLDGIRDLMAGNQLSAQTELALREKLKVERQVLRNRVAEAELAAKTKAEQESAAKTGTAAPAAVGNTTINNSTSIQVILSDRRPSQDLENAELRRRLEVYRQAAEDQQYEDDRRAYWRDAVQRDEELLRERMMQDRRQRQTELSARIGDDDFNIEIGLQFDPSRRQRDVYAAEVDDEELEDVLAAPPRREVSRRYTLEEVTASPELREALPRVEIDTVRFGFNEAFVRAEEVRNLDRIAEIMERIIAKHPREVFLIEGHTDAVGSDETNLDLSRKRATAIKQALTTYYVIPGVNLQTVGYGERYLKIPTADAEQENRRVSVSRATALIGQLE
jgi:outer membrane protein OmpA-like peptidoglycan-associated protein